MLVEANKNNTFCVIYRGRITSELAKLLATNKGKFCDNSNIGPLISKQLSVENKTKLSQQTREDFVTTAKLAH